MNNNNNIPGIYFNFSIYYCHSWSELEKREDITWIVIFIIYPIFFRGMEAVSKAIPWLLKEHTSLWLELLQSDLLTECKMDKTTLNFPCNFYVHQKK